jgi:hypothetical protein
MENVWKLLKMFNVINSYLNQGSSNLQEKLTEAQM